jgi:SAM-dependent methyltransferase
MANTEIFTGKARAYAMARPGYPDAAAEYVASLAPPNAVFADVGAGTGKFTAALARRGYSVFAVEPNADMRGRLAAALAPYPNAKVVAGAAENTALPDHSVDAVVCAQALHWFDLDAFRLEYRRICKPGGAVAAVYNIMPGGASLAHSKLSTDAFFVNPAVREFPNPLFFTRESWLAYRSSHSRDPLPSDSNYAAHIAEASAAFDRENVGGLLRRDAVTRVYSEIL